MIGSTGIYDPGDALLVSALHAPELAPVDTGNASALVPAVPFTPPSAWPHTSVVVLFDPTSVEILQG